MLEKLGSGSTAREVAKTVGCCKTNIFYWKEKLLRAGALKLQTADVFKIYSLTPYGSKVLARSETSVSETVALEDYAFKFSIVEPEKARMDWKKLGSPRNWQQLGVNIGSVKVERTNKHVIIHPGKLKGFDHAELEVESGRIIERTKMILENKFGMVLSRDGVSLRKPIYRFYTEEAKVDVKYGTCVVDGVGSIDNSPPERVPHEEYVGPERAEARLMMPVTLKRVEGKVDDLSACMREVHELLKTLIQVTTEVRDGLRAVLTEDRLESQDPQKQRMAEFYVC